MLVDKIILSMLCAASIGSSYAKEYGKLNVQKKQELCSSISIHGLKDLSSKDLMKAMKSKSVSFDHPEKIAENLTEILNDKGYFLAEVRFEKQEHGRLYFYANEGRISGLEIIAEKNINDRIIKKIESYCDEILKYQPLHKNNYEKYLLLADELYGVEVSASLEKTGFAESKLIVEAKNYKRMGLSIGANNYLNIASGENQYLAASTLNLPEINARTAVSGGISRENKASKTFVVEHSQNFGQNGVNLTAKLVRGLGNKNNKLLNSKLETENVGLYYTYPVLKNLSYGLYLKAKFDSNYAKNISTSNVSDDYLDRVRALRFNMHYEFLDKFTGANILEAEYSRGLKGMGAHDNSFVPRSRVGGRNDFSKLNLSWYRSYDFANKWGLVTHIFGQKSFNSLLSSEEFEFGGFDIGRGYQSSCLYGDHGIAAKFELHYKKPCIKYLSEIDSFVFYDIGVAYNNTAKVAKNVVLKKASAASLGVGFNLKANEFLKANVSFGKPLTRVGEKGFQTKVQVIADLI